MRVENRTVVLESTDCRRCRHYFDLENGRGWIREPIQDDCPNCLGTGRTKKGKGKGQCKWYSRESHARLQVRFLSLPLGKLEALKGAECPELSFWFGVYPDQERPLLWQT